MSRTHTTTIQIGTAIWTFTTHHVPGIGPRVSMRIEEPPAPAAVYNLSPDQLRAISMHAKIAACEAEAIAKREQNRKEQAA